ncbi:dihydrofolate reductase [Paenibacillus anaericanus]|uniref:Dihydrofolate reductase n=1 Tax=Paenibacillus anaericanus TaxID=170367 RepID=A0A433Y629_9BACL|nr:dihydrofolate reductase [Paenibacillus anaericanus]RUT44472.1 dihydrofolate reductase [Paenibacillus anaericanus]
MIISLIAAISKNKVIGMDEVIPWSIPGEQIRFKDLTLGKSIIMGRKTYESIGKPLPNRRTIIVSRNPELLVDNCLTVRSLDEAFRLLKEEEEIFIAGGGEIYKEALPQANKIYLTVIDKEIEGNIYFPEFNKEDYITTYEKRNDGEMPYTYYTYERKESIVV